MVEKVEFVPPVFIKYFDQEFDNEEDRIKAIKELADRMCKHDPNTTKEKYVRPKKEKVIVPKKPRVVKEKVVKAKKVKKKNYRKKIPDDVKAAVMKRDKNKCCNCGSKTGIHVHHVIHREHGGQDTVDNLKLLCDLCHAEEHRGEAVYNIMIQSLWQYESA